MWWCGIRAIESRLVVNMNTTVAEKQSLSVLSPESLMGSCCLLFFSPSSLRCAPFYCCRFLFFLLDFASHDPQGGHAIEMKFKL